MNTWRKVGCCLAFAAGVSFIASAEPTVSATAETVSVTVPAGEVTSPCGIILCWGDACGGDTVDSWQHSHVLTTNELTAAGGTFSVPSATLGLVRGQPIRAFVVPGEVRRVEYVASDQSTGGTNPSIIYFNTGVRARSGLRVETDMMWLSLDDNEFCGGRYKSGDPTRIFPVHTYQGKWFQGYGNDGITTAYACEANRRYQVDARLYDGLQSLTVVDVEAETTTLVNNRTTTGLVDTTGVCYLLGAHYPGQYEDAPWAAGGVSRARCYAAKLYENGHPETNMTGTLVRDFVPVKDYFGHGAVYDQLNGNLHLSQFFCYGSTKMLYASCGEETGEVIELLQPEIVVSYSCAQYFLMDSVEVKVRTARIDVSVLPGVVGSKSNALVVCWGDHDYGEKAADWPHCLDEKPMVGSDGGKFVFPTAGIELKSSVRVFLVGTIDLVDWISSPDNDKATVSYLDTGVKAKHGLRTRARIEWLKIINDCGFLGVRPDSSDTRFLPIYSYQTGQWGLGYGTGNWNKGAYERNKPYEVESKLYVGEQLLKVDKDELYTGTSTWDPDYEHTIYAFAVNWYGNPRVAKYGSCVKCYYLQMYTGGSTDNPEGTLTRDYLPAALDGVGGLYDRQNGTFTPSAGSTAFSVGSVTNTVAFLGATDYAAPSRTYVINGLILMVR